MKLIGKTTSYDKIVAYMKDDEAKVDLTEHEKELIIRWQEAFSILRNRTTSDAAAILMKRFPGLSRASAYRDCTNAINLFGDISKSNKEGIRHLSTEMIREAYAIAKGKNNEDAMIKAAVAIAKVNGVNIIDPETFNWEELEPHTFVLGISERMVKAFEAMIRGGKIDLSKVVSAMGAQAEDAVIIEESKQLPDGNK
jgi:tellurite resistance protein